MGLRAEAEQDLFEMIEDEEDFGLPIVLISPSGVRYDKNAHDETRRLTGQVLHNVIPRSALGRDNAGYTDFVVHDATATLRVSSLSRVPQQGETWGVLIPQTPLADAPIIAYLAETPFRDGDAAGTITLYLTRTAQAPSPPEEPEP
jgi:hypothetical protein